MQPIVLLFGASHFLAEKGKTELIFLDREDFNFLWEDRNV